MGTPISEYRDFVRLLLQDLDPDIHLFDNDQVDNAVKLKVSLGKVPGYAIGGLDSDEIEPVLTMESDGPSYGRLVYHAARCFAVGLAATQAVGFSTRAYARRTGKPQEIVDEIVNTIYDMEFGEMAS